ncbi:MAG: hypothetical protein ACQEUT_04765 [Bacillota bacterium]
MLRSEKGFGTAEALVAISAIFIVMLIFLPFIMNLVSDLEKKESDLTAARVLYEHLEEDLFSGRTENHIYRREDQIFEIKDRIENGSICIYYNDHKDKNHSFCLSEEVRE